MNHIYEINVPSFFPPIHIIIELPIICLFDSLTNISPQNLANIEYTENIVKV